VFEEFRRVGNAAKKVEGKTKGVNALLLYLVRVLPFLCGAAASSLALKNQALHQELAVYKPCKTRPRLPRTDRLSRVGLASVPGWVQTAS